MTVITLTTNSAVCLIYGIGTVLFPFFLMQPSLGLGIAASRTPKQTQARLRVLWHIPYSESGCMYLHWA